MSHSSITTSGHADSTSYINGPPSSSLSTAVFNISAHLGNQLCVKDKLGKYQATGTNDKTLDTLPAFDSCLPLEGLTNLMDVIIGCHSDEQLRLLSSELMSAVLISSKCVLTYLRVLCTIILIPATNFFLFS